MKKINKKGFVQIFFMPQVIVGILIFIFLALVVEVFVLDKPLSLISNEQSSLKSEFNTYCSNIFDCTIDEKFDKSGSIKQSQEQILYRLNKKYLYQEGPVLYVYLNN